MLVSAIADSFSIRRLMLAAQARYPWVRRQTLAGKAFLACWPAAFGCTSFTLLLLTPFGQDSG